MFCHSPLTCFVMDNNHSFPVFICSSWKDISRSFLFDTGKICVNNHVYMYTPAKKKWQQPDKLGMSKGISPVRVVILALLLLLLLFWFHFFLLSLWRIRETCWRNWFCFMYTQKEKVLARNDEILSDREILLPDFCHGNEARTRWNELWRWFWLKGNSTIFHPTHRKSAPTFQKAYVHRAFLHLISPCSSTNALNSILNRLVVWKSY